MFVPGKPFQPSPELKDKHSSLFWKPYITARNKFYDTGHLIVAVNKCHFKKSRYGYASSSPLPSSKWDTALWLVLIKPKEGSSEKVNETKIVQKKYEETAIVFNFKSGFFVTSVRIHMKSWKLSPGFVFGLSLSESPTHLQPEEEVVAGHGVTLAKVLRHRQRHVLLQVHRRPLCQFQNFFSASLTPMRNKLKRPSLANVFRLCLMYVRKADTQGQDNDIQTQ